MLRPATEAELSEIVGEAAATGGRLAIRGGGSKIEIGAPEENVRALEMRGFDGVVDYDPPELVLTVRAGTRLAEVQALVAGQNQMLAFEPFDHGPIFGRPAGDATIGGVVAANVSGSQRISSGALRDHLLGVRAVSGRGELFVSGAKVVKNVTGYDLPKLLAGSWGRLAALTEVTLKVLPAPRMAVTCVLRGLAPEAAVQAMAAAMGSQAEVAAAAHRPMPEPMTLFRLQGFNASVTARMQALERRLAPFGQLQRAAEAEALWEELRSLAPLPVDVPLWRVSVPPAAGGGLGRTLQALGAEWLLDWAGGLAWISMADGAAVRQAAAAAGGHAMLLRGPAALRAVVPAFHPQASALAALEGRVRKAFDPAGVFETGRF